MVLCPPSAFAWPVQLLGILGLHVWVGLWLLLWALSAWTYFCNRLPRFSLSWAARALASGFQPASCFYGLTACVNRRCCNEPLTLTLSSLKTCPVVGLEVCPGHTVHGMQYADDT